MSLPQSRNTTYAPGVPVKSADLNDIQDQIVSLAEFEVVLPASAGRWFQSLGDTSLQSAKLLMQESIPSRVLPLSGSSIVEYALAVPVGWQIVEARAVVFGNTQSPVAGRLYAANLVAGAKTQLGATKLSTLAETVQTLTVGTGEPGVPHVVGAGESLVYEVQFGPTPTGQEIRGVAFRYRR